jgi:hypothetical protein
MVVKYLYETFGQVSIFRILLSFSPKSPLHRQAENH